MAGGAPAVAGAAAGRDAGAAVAAGGGRGGVALASDGPAEAQAERAEQSSKANRDVPGFFDLNRMAATILYGIPPIRKRIKKSHPIGRLSSSPEVIRTPDPVVNSGSGALASSCT